MSRRPATSLAGSPILIGAVTVLVVVIAVFLAYNANSGLPFVPTYSVTVAVPDAAGLVEGNEVRVGGKRVGTIETIVGHIGPRGPYAKLALKLDKTLEPLRDDSQVTVRPRSPLGLKYLELVLGARGRKIAQGGQLPLARGRGTVELDQVINTFDAQTRDALQRTLDQGGPALAGRGADFNQALAAAPELLLRLDRVAGNLADRRTGLRRTIQAAGRVADELSPVAPQLGSLIDGADRTLRALASVSPELSQVLAQLPGTELAGIRALSAARPVLRDARGLVHDVKPGIGVLPLAAGRLHAALQTGIPVLRRASALSQRLRAALHEVYLLASDPLARSTLARLRIALDSLIPTLRFVAPVQTKCNYISVYLRNIASTVSEGDASGNWLRTLSIGEPSQARSQPRPSPNLHANPYPYTAAPGQHGLCEAGNEPYTPGQRIGHVPGVKAHFTENVTPPYGGPAR
ncbi:MAG: phospholipid/cholesterol/gamma-HCH transport system substrate-binding protein [Thermoleophilaceae bacterium]|nr:phospholipid/cholesterol/gamma-HCH transport system substrate-binding protein [Thermoleophilaceae bacterium]